MIPPAIRAYVVMGMVLLASVVLLAGCGQASAYSPIATSSPTVLLPTATATATATPTAIPPPTHGPTGSTCQPDIDAIYSSQAGFVATLTDAPLPAPPQTKHGIGSAGVNANVLQGGESGVCTIGTFASVTSFYTQRLTALGWHYSAPPTTLGACFHGSVPARAWWKGSSAFAWYDNGSAGGGSIFWSYTYCSTQAG